MRIAQEHLSHKAVLLASLEGCDVLINLSGAPISKRWNEAYKTQLYSSRVDVTKTLIDTIVQLKNKPHTFISASSVSIYKANATCDEYSMDFGTNYLAGLIKDWEAQALRCEHEIGLRTIILRFAVVLGCGGGIYRDMKRTFSMGLGGFVEDKSTPFCWVHITDAINLIEHSIFADDMSGIYNVVAPEITTTRTFMKSFGKSIKRPAWLCIPEKILHLRYGEASSHLLKGAFVISTRLEQIGYKFIYGNLYTALQSLEYEDK